MRFDIQRYDHKGDRVGTVKHAAEGSAKVPTAVRKILGMDRTAAVEVHFDDGTSTEWRIHQPRS